MRWTPSERTDIEDRRGMSGGMMRRGAPLGIGGLLILLVLSYVTGQDFLSLLGTGDGQVVSEPSAPGGPVQSTPEEERVVDFVNVVLKDGQDVWNQLLGNRYERTTLVLFRQGVESACGFAESASGPFYCPADQKVYLDVSFFEELDRRFGAPGDFAQAYVVTHELGHHIQALLGTNRSVHQLQQQSSPEDANALSVRLELQADCFAGVWGHATAQSGRPANAPALDPDDVEEGLRAAAAIGDDRLQKMSGRGIRPEGFTHGSSQQRVSWLKRGLESGDPRACDTFGRGGTE